MKKIRYKIVISAVLITMCFRLLQAQIQPPSPFVVSNVDWKKYYSQVDAMNSAPNALDVNSNFYSTGYTGTATQKDLIVLKYDSIGNLIYNYPYNNGGNDEGKAIKVDPFGNAIIAGVADNITGGSLKDFVVMKLSPAGVLLWPAVVLFDGGGNKNDEAVDISFDSNGDIYCTGKSETATGDFNIITIKLSGMNGSVLWQHSYNSGGADAPSAICISEDGQKIYVTGNATHPTAGTTDIVTYALDASSGSYYWSPVVTGSMGNDLSKAMVIKNGNITICGEKDNSSLGTGADYTLIQYDGLSGALLWSHDYDSGSSQETATGLAVDSAGNIGVVGKSYNGVTYEYHTIMYTSFGIKYGTTNIEHTGLISLSADPKICNDTIAHHWYISGEKMKTTKDIFVYQVTPGGTTAWRETIDGPNGDDCATGIAVNGVGVVYAGGLSMTSASNYDYTSIKINQTPLYFPPDFANEPVNRSHLYLKNEGQLMRSDSVHAAEVLYYTHNTTPEVYIEQDAFNFVYSRTDTIETTLDTLERMQFKFLNANPLANHHEYLPKSTTYNYYLGYALSPEIEDIRGNERIFVPNFYPYIDLHYFSGKGGIKYYLVVKPGAFLGEIRMQINGSVSNSIDSKYNDGILIDGQLGSMVLDKPIAYTVNWSGAVVPITTGQADWLSYGSDLYGITPPTYNPAMPLIIQVSASQVAAVPSVNRANLDYSTYYGGQGNERFSDIAVAANGDRHVTGYADAITFPAVNSLQQHFGQQDVVFLKYTPDDTLRYASFIGGSDPDFGHSIAVDVNNEVFVGGQTNSKNFRFQSLAGADNQISNGNAGSGSSWQDGFLFKYIPSNTPGQKLIWSRYFGGEASDAIQSVHVDGSGNLYLAGWTNSSQWFPTTPNAAQPNMPWPVTIPGNIDAVFGKISPNLKSDWVTLCGVSSNTFGAATANEKGWDVTTDNSGNVIVCGYAETSGLPRVNTTGNSNVFWQNKRGPTDGLLMVYSPSGQVKYRSYFGGDGFDQITNLYHDPQTDNTYFCGTSDNLTNFPFHSKLGATNSQFKARQNAFIGYIDGSFSKQWCSYYGKGINKDYYTTGIAADNYGLVYMSGYTKSDSLEYPSANPVTVVYKDSVYKGGDDGYLAIYSPSKTLYHSHYFGGSNDERIHSISIGQNQKLWATGYTDSNNFPIAYTSVNATEMDSTYNGRTDGFISGFDLENYQITEIKEYAFEQSVISVYPNPANSQFYIDLEDQYKIGSEIRIYNLSGQLIFEEKTNSAHTQITCESWANGVYLITVRNNTAYSSFKFIKD